MNRFSRLAHDNTERLVLQTIDVHERSAKECLARWSKRRHCQLPLLVEWLQYLSAGARLLDLGCGGGQDADVLTKQGYRVVGLDRASAWLLAGRRRYRSVPLVLADIRYLPLRVMSFDGIWAAASLIHLPKPDAWSYPERSAVACPSKWFLRRDSDLWHDEPSRDGWVATGELCGSLEKGGICSRHSSSRMDNS